MIRPPRAPRWLLFLGLTGLIVVVALVVIDATRTGPQPLGIPGKWHLVLDSEFDGSKLPAEWNAGWLGRGVTRPVNGSLENDCYSPRNVTFPGDDTLHLNVTAASSTCAGITRPFTGAIVTTDPDDRRGSGFQYTYGVMQARIYVPANGTQIADWPAVWAEGQDWPQDGEDDIIEGLAGQACFHFHDPLGGPGSCDTKITPGWHTVASDWQKGSVTFYYDGTKVGSITSGITSAPMFLLLDDTTTTDDPIADSMRIKYVRVWQS